MPESSPTTKSRLRADIRTRLHNLTNDERRAKSIQICRRIFELDLFQQASTVMMYMPLPEEVDVTPLAIRCFQRGMVVCVPRVNWQKRDMAPVEVHSFDDARMDIDEHGIRVPREHRMIPPEFIDLVVLPGLAFDAAGNRLGRGGGYYDRFLAKLPKAAPKLAVAFDEQIVDRVPTQRFDVRVDFVVTDRRMTKSPPNHVA